jgi:hypothetical protein
MAAVDRSGKAVMMFAEHLTGPAGFSYGHIPRDRSCRASSLRMTHELLLMIAVASRFLDGYFENAAPAGGV